MKGKKRAIRRQTLETQKERAKRRLKFHHLYGNEPLDRVIGILANTKTLCSCFMCGNPRKSSQKKDRLSIQEKRVLIEKDLSYLKGVDLGGRRYYKQ